MIGLWRRCDHLDVCGINCRAAIRARNQAHIRLNERGWYDRSVWDRGDPLSHLQRSLFVPPLLPRAFFWKSHQHTHKIIIDIERGEPYVFTSIGMCKDRWRKSSRWTREKRASELPSEPLRKKWLQEADNEWRGMRFTREKAARAKLGFPGKNLKWICMSSPIGQVCDGVRRDWPSLCSGWANGNEEGGDFGKGFPRRWRAGRYEILWCKLFRGKKA